MFNIHPHTENFLHSVNKHINKLIPTNDANIIAMG